MPASALVRLYGNYVEAATVCIVITCRPSGAMYKSIHEPYTTFTTSIQASTNH